MRLEQLKREEAALRMVEEEEIRQMEYEELLRQEQMLQMSDPMLI